MKIARVHLHPLTIPLVEPLVIAIGEFPDLQAVLVRIELDDGTIGIGEAAPLPIVTGETQATCVAIGRDCARILVGEDARAIGARMESLDRYVPGQPSIKAAFDMALWDLRGRLAGQPVFQLLGGGSDVVETDETISIGEPRAMVDKAVALRERGFRAIKLKIGGPDPAAEVQTVAAVRDAVGDDVALRLDANQGWDVPTALHVLRQLAPFDIQYCEQPVAARDLEGLRRVRRGTSIPIMADEAVFTSHDALRLIRMDACDYLNIKLQKCGGISEGARIAAIARAAGMRCMVGCMVETRLSVGAAAHLAASHGAIAFADLDGFSHNTTDPIVGGIAVAPGRLVLPDEPGLGCAVDPDVLRSLETITVAA